MDVIVILLIVSLLVALIFLMFYMLSVRSGQFEDTFSPGHRIMFEDQDIKKKTNN